MDQASGPHLGNYGSNVGNPGQELVAPPWELMRWLWSHSGLEGLQKCHRVRYQAGVDVFVAESGQVTYGGFCRCHSVWACPLCAPLIRAGRAREMAGGLRRLLASGGGVNFSTFTLPHDQGMPLGRLFDSVAGSWKLVQFDRAVKAMRRSLGLEFSRSTEVTLGGNGWHPHLHVGEVCERPLTRDEVAEYRETSFHAWCRAVVSFGLRPPSDRYGLTMIRADAGMADYCHKVEGLSSELFRMDRKTGKTEAPFSILRRAVAGDVEAARRWREYEMVTKGRRMLGQSRGFKRLCPYDEAEDSALVEGEPRKHVGTLVPDLAHLLINHPRGFEGFAEMVGPGTDIAWTAALNWLTGSAPLWLTQAGIDKLFGPDLELPERASSGVAYQQGELL